MFLPRLRVPRLRERKARKARKARKVESENHYAQRTSNPSEWYADGCPEWGTATDRTDRGEIQNTHMAYKSYRPHEEVMQDGCPK